jgi:chemotaxis response regulator CheB
MYGDHDPYEPSSGFPIVGIGASAGGLKAFTQLFEQLPAVTGMAYVVIQHLDSTHASLLPPLLARVTTIPGHEGQDGMLVEPNQVYIIPPIDAPLPALCHRYQSRSAPTCQSGHLPRQ